MNATYQPSIQPASPRQSVGNLLRYFWSTNRSMTILFVAMLITTILSLIGMALDPRTVTNQSTWAKTTKFSISITFYAASMLWIFSLDTLRPRLSRFILTASAWLLGVEMVLIIFQGARATTMHFNNTTPFDSTLYSIMGMTITIFWFVSALGVAVLVAQQVSSRTLAWSLRLGLIVALIGMLLGYLMTSPTPDQLTAMQAGQGTGFIGAHTVGPVGEGVVDGGPGLPLLGWSTVHGDLRIGHFIGLHGLQIIPLLGLFLMLRREPWLTERHKLSLIVIGALGYLGLVGLLTWQALRGQAIIAPDALTLSALTALVVATAGAAALVLWRARSESSRLVAVSSAR